MWIQSCKTKRISVYHLNKSVQPLILWPTVHAGPDLPNSWVINLLSEGHWSLWLLLGWWISKEGMMKECPGWWREDKEWWSGDRTHLSTDGTQHFFKLWHYQPILGGDDVTGGLQGHLVGQIEAADRNILSAVWGKSSSLKMSILIHNDHLNLSFWHHCWIGGRAPMRNTDKLPHLEKTTTGCYNVDVHLESCLTSLRLDLGC